MPAKKGKSRRTNTKMPTFFPEISRRIDQIKAMRKLTFKDMAKDLRVTVSTLQAIKDNRVTPNIYIIRQLKKVYNVSYDWLFDGDGDPGVQSSRSLEAQVQELRELITSKQKK